MKFTTKVLVLFFALLLFFAIAHKLVSSLTLIMFALIATAAVMAIPSKGELKGDSSIDRPPPKLSRGGGMDCD